MTAKKAVIAQRTKISVTIIILNTYNIKHKKKTDEWQMYRIQQRGPATELALVSDNKQLKRRYSSFLHKYTFDLVKTNYSLLYDYNNDGTCLFLYTIDK